MSSTAEEFFAWEPHGIGRRWLPCPGCDSRAPVQLLENLMEVLCPSCGRSVALERVRALEASQGKQVLAECLVNLGLLEPEEAKALAASTGASGLADTLIDQGHLRRDLRLTLELDGAEGRSVYRARPMVDVALGAEVEAALETRSERGGVLTEILRESILQRLGATIRSIGASAGLESWTAETQTDWDSHTLSVRALESFRCVPLRREGKTLVVALWNPIDFRLVADLEALLGDPVDAVLADPRAIDDALARLGVTPAASDPTAAAKEPDGEGFELAEDPFYGVLMEALEEGASEVLIEPRGVDASLRFRVRGELRKERPLPREVVALLAEQLEGLIPKSAGDAGVNSGTIRYELSGLPVTLDCRILQTPLGPSVALVLEDEHSRGVNGLSQLGLSLEGLAALEAVLAKGRGIVVVAGPQRIERTQAYHAILERAVRLGGGVISLEGRLGSLIPGATQLDLQGLKPSSFGTLLHPLPDWLGIDGPLGALTLRLAVDVALHGNAVVITVPAPDGESALLRLELAGVPRRLLEISVCAVLARRVLPRVCPHCRFSRESRTPGGSQSYVGLGCAACADQGTAEPLPLAELVRPYGQGTQAFTGTSTLAERVRALVAAGDVQPEAVSDLLGG